MKPVLVFAALASILYYAFYGHQEWVQSVEQLRLTSRTMGATKKQLSDFKSKERDQEDEIVLLEGKVAEVENDLGKAKLELAKFQQAPTPVVAQQTVAPPPKPVERPGPSLEQMMNRKNEIGLTYRILILADGTVLRDATVSKIGNGLITYNSPTGEVTVKKDNLPVGMVDKFGLNFDETPIASAEVKPVTESPDQESEDISSFGAPASKQSKMVGEATPFGFEIKDDPKNASKEDANSSKVGSSMAAIIDELHARAEQLRATANAATDPSEAQQLRDKASKFDKQADDLKASLGE